jgi:hypothetical protein
MELRVVEHGPMFAPSEGPARTGKPARGQTP